MKKTQPHHDSGGVKLAGLMFLDGNRSVSKGKGIKAEVFTRRELLKLLGGAGIVSAFAPLRAVAGKEKTDKPNIVLIVADDMGWSDAGCYGGEIQTPNIDRLAAEGLRFSQFYNNAVCAPTRASLMTGLYPRGNSRLSPNMVTLAQVLRSAGYRTSISGKWNCQRQNPSSPLDWGFEEFYGFLDMPSNYFNPALRDLKFGKFRPPIMRNRKPVSKFPKDYYVTDAINDHALEMIKQFSKSKDPFFVYVGHLAPHSPLQAKPEDIKRYRGKFMEGWDLLRKKRHQRQLKMGLVDPGWQLPDDDPDVSPWDQEKNKQWQDLRMAVYAAMIDCMDQGIGRIIQTLRDCGVDQNTIILFLSDNGGAKAEMKWDKPDITPGGIDTYCFSGPGWGFLQNTPFRGFKQGLHEGGIATPLIVRWPGKVKSDGAITSQVGHVIDILPTFCEIAGITCPGEYKGQKITPSEGKSLAGVFQGKQRAAHEWLFWEHVGNKAVRRGKWKLVGRGDPGELKNWELYDLAADRTELKNLAQKYPERLKQMAQAWRHWAKRTNWRSRKGKQ